MAGCLDAHALPGCGRLRQLRFAESQQVRFVCPSQRRSFFGGIFGYGAWMFQLRSGGLGPLGFLPRAPFVLVGTGVRLNVDLTAQTLISLSRNCRCLNGSDIIAATPAIVTSWGWHGTRSRPVQPNRSLNPCPCRWIPGRAPPLPPTAQVDHVTL